MVEQKIHSNFDDFRVTGSFLLNLSFPDNMKKINLLWTAVHHKPLTLIFHFMFLLLHVTEWVWGEKWLWHEFCIKHMHTYLIGNDPTMKQIEWVVHNKSHCLNGMCHTSQGSRGYKINQRLQICVMRHESEWGKENPPYKRFFSHELIKESHSSSSFRQSN